MSKEKPPPPPLEGWPALLADHKVDLTVGDICIIRELANMNGDHRPIALVIRPVIRAALRSVHRIMRLNLKGREAEGGK